MDNKGLVNADTKKRKLLKKKATPFWLTKEHILEMQEIYKDAQDLLWLNEEGLHVDHIVPLQGKTVCGLHVPWNLQILTSSKNIRKSNKL